jgi:hypothetical protein
MSIEVLMLAEPGINESLLNSLALTEPVVIAN